MMGYLWQRLRISILGMATDVYRRLRGSDRRERYSVNAEDAAIVVHALQIGQQ